MPYKKAIYEFIFISQLIHKNHLFLLDLTSIKRNRHYNNHQTLFYVLASRLTQMQHSPLTMSLSCLLSSLILCGKQYSACPWHRHVPLASNVEMANGAEGGLSEVAVGFVHVAEEFTDAGQV